MAEKLERAYQIYDEILEIWEHEETDNESGEIFYKPNSLKQIELTEEKLNSIEELSIEDEEFLELIEQVKSLIDHDLVGLTIYNEIIEHWEYAEIDPKTKEELYHPTSLSQIEFSRTKLKEIDKLSIIDEELQERTETIRNIINEAPKRKFAGSIWMMVIIGIFVAMSAFSNLGTFFRKVGGYYDVENAKSIYAIENQRINGQIEYYQQQPDTYKNKDKYLNEYHKKKEKHEKLSPEKYVKQRNSYHRLRSIKNLWSAIFLIGLYVGYYYASRAPIYVLNHRKKERELMKKSSNFVKKLIFGTLAAAWSTPVTTYVTKWSDGSETRENDALAILFISLILTVLVLMLVFYVMMIALPFLVVINYIRNYQIDKYQAVMDKIKAKF